MLKNFFSRDTSHTTETMPHHVSKENHLLSMGPSENNPLHEFEVDRSALILTKEGKVPLTYWVVAPNFGDLLSPWLIGKLSNKAVELVQVKVNSKKHKLRRKTYIAIGSVLSRVQDNSIVWGSGSFGTEKSKRISLKATYHAVRGPLTRCLIMNEGIDCPKTYGDPALLAPLIFDPDVEVTHEVGVVIRWSDNEWRNAQPQTGIKLIDLGTSDIESVIREIKSCKKIITSSLHGLIIADTYGIANAWLSSTSPKGGEFKFYDYFTSVDKMRHAQQYDIENLGLNLNFINSHFNFDDRPISFNPYGLLDACPFLKRINL